MAYKTGDGKIVNYYKGVIMKMTFVLLISITVLSCSKVSAQSTNNSSSPENDPLYSRYSHVKPISDSRFNGVFVQYYPGQDITDDYHTVWTFNGTNKATETHYGPLPPPPQHPLDKPVRSETVITYELIIIDDFLYVLPWLDYKSPEERETFKKYIRESTTITETAKSNFIFSTDNPGGNEPLILGSYSFEDDLFILQPINSPNPQRFKLKK